MAGPFDAAMDFGPWHCVGKEDRVAFTHRDTGETRELKADLYFGYFAQQGGDTDSRLYRLDRDCNILWRSAFIAVDGVIIRGFSEDAVTLSCEMDPPGGWVTRRLSIATGEEL